MQGRLPLLISSLILFSNVALSGGLPKRPGPATTNVAKGNLGRTIPGGIISSTVKKAVVGVVRLVAFTGVPSAVVGASVHFALQGPCKYIDENNNTVEIDNCSGIVVALQIGEKAWAHLKAAQKENRKMSAEEIRELRLAEEAAISGALPSPTAAK